MRSGRRSGQRYDSGNNGSLRYATEVGLAIRLTTGEAYNDVTHIAPLIQLYCAEHDRNEESSMTTQTESPTRLHGRWLLLARLAWTAVFLTLTVMYALGFLAVHETLSTICDPEPCSLREQIRRTDAGEQIIRSAGPPVGYADRLRPEQNRLPRRDRKGFSMKQISEPAEHPSYSRNPGV